MEGGEGKVYFDEPQKEEGKFFIELPFWGWIEVDEERYKEEKARQERIELEEKNSWFKRHENQELLDAMGHTTLHHHVNRPDAGGYEDAIMKVLQNNWVTHIDQIPERIKQIASSEENSSESAALVVAADIFSSFMVNLHEKQDQYEEAILGLISTYEQYVPYRLLTQKEYENLYTLFKLWHITSLHLYYRCEELKNKERVFYYQRMFTFGTDSAQHGYDPSQPPQEMERLDRLTRYQVYGALANGRVTKEEMEPDPGKFHAKIKTAYVDKLKEEMASRERTRHSVSLLPDEDDRFDSLGEEQRNYLTNLFQDIHYINRPGYREQMLPGERNFVVKLLLEWKGSIDYHTDIIRKREKKNVAYNYMSSHKMQNVFGFSREELHAITNATKKEFIGEFIDSIDSLTTDSFKEHDASLTIGWKYIEDTIAAIEEAAPYYGIEIGDLRGVLKEKMVTILRELTQKIDTKEVKRREEIVREKRSQDTYLWQLKDYLAKADEACSVLEKLGFGTEEAAQNRRATRERYRNEFKVHHTQEFIKKRQQKLIQSLALDTTDKEKLRAQIVTAATKRFIEVYKKAMASQKKKDSFSDRMRFQSNKLNALLRNGVLFADGYFTLVKGIITVATHRKKFWDEVCKEIIGNAIADARDKLMNPATVENEAFMALDPLMALIKRYEGSATEFAVDKKKIVANYYAYALPRIDADMKRRVDAVERFLAGKGKKNMTKIYTELWKLETYLQYFLSLCYYKHIPESKRWKSKEDAPYTDYFLINKEHYRGQYPGSYLIALSRMGVSPAMVEEIVPDSVITPIIWAFQKVEKLQKRFFTAAVEGWFRINALPGGKLQRVVSEHISATESSEIVREEAIQYIIDNISTLVINDLALMLMGIAEINRFLWDQEAIIAECVAVILEQRKQKMGQSYLTGSEQDQIS